MSTRRSSGTTAALLLLATALVTGCDAWAGPAAQNAAAPLSAAVRCSPSLTESAFQACALGGPDQYPGRPTHPRHQAK